MKRVLLSIAAAALVGGSATYLALADHHEEKKWEVHDMSRPKPTVITPSKIGDPESKVFVTAPSDAEILFDGKDLSKWQATGGGDATWKVEGGAMVAAGKDLQTKDSFGDAQIHVEWASPEKVEGEGQGRGNSGVYIMGNYEVQVLDSYKNDTYADGQAGALYGQFPPLVNASLPPGQWQNYDIVFHRPRFGEDGKVTKPATMTVFHNGVLVQDHTELRGTTSHHSPGVYTQHADKLPIRLQFHGNPTRFRNIWIRQLEK
jgi:hypothetical protein